MFGWQNLVFDVVLAVGFMSVVTLYGYWLQRGLSVGGLLLSWNFSDSYRAAVLLPPFLVLATAVILVGLDKSWLLPGLWLASAIVLVMRTGLLVVTKRLASVRQLDWLVSGVIAVVLSYIVNQLIMYAEPNLAISPSNVAAILWSFGVLVLLFLGSQLVPSRFSDVHTNRQHIARLYRQYYKKFATELHGEFLKDVHLQRLFFAILITEDMNRPGIFRFFERLFFPLGFIGTTGIMQVTDKNKLTDNQSVVLAQELINGYYQAAKKQHKTEYMRIQEVAYLYNDGDFYTELIAHTYFTLTELSADQGATAKP